MVRPEPLGEHLVHEIVRCVLHHLDLFENHRLLFDDVGRRERRTQHHVAEQVERDLQVLVEHLDVVAGVFLGGERVQLAADRIDRLGDVLGGSGGRALEEHVLDEMCDPALGLGFVPRTPRDPDTRGDRTDVRHRLGDESQTGRQGFRDYHGDTPRVRASRRARAQHRK